MSFDNDALRLVTASIAPVAGFDRNESPSPPFYPSADCARGSGMSSTGSAELYRTHAAQCIEIALRAPVETRLELLNIAQAWLALAEHADKNVHAPTAVYETPERQQHAIQQQQQPQPDDDKDE
jgi:hypothetical protein